MISPEEQEKLLSLPEREFLEYVLQGDQEAISFFQTLCRISQTWDDLIDQDKAVSPVEINRAFWMALVALPGNGFYQQHFRALHTLITGAIFDWWDSEELKRSAKKEHQAVAYTLRSAVSVLLGHIVYLSAGYEWHCKVSSLIRRYIYTDSLDEYIKSNSTK